MILGDNTPYPKMNYTISVVKFKLLLQHIQNINKQSKISIINALKIFLQAERSNKNPSATATIQV